MLDLTVHCGCGRQMKTDGLRGRGAYRCGCGAQIRVDVRNSVGERCVFIKDGNACRMPALTLEPVPLCKDHVKALKAYFIGFITEQALSKDEADILVAAWLERAADGANDREVYLQHRANALADEEYMSPRNRNREVNGVVYYVRFGDRIKIGTSTDLAQRLIGIPHDEVLATEPGGPKVERSRHEQFAHLRITGEWFSAAPDLMKHIRSLRKAVNA